MTKPPVAPVEGHYALLRNGMVVKHMVDMWDAHRGPKTKRDYWTSHPDTDFSDLCWHEDGKSHDDGQYDIIATISPADMQSVASGELERLRAEVADLIAACDAALDWADANARWFDISTAPRDEGVSFLVTTEVRSHLRSWTETHVVHLNEEGEIHPDCHQGWSLRDYWHWRPLPPPPSNPPLPAPLEALGAVVRRVKGVG